MSAAELVGAVMSSRRQRFRFSPTQCYNILYIPKYALWFAGMPSA